MAYLEKELGDLFIPSEWNKDTVQRSRQQMNGSDCGVFTLLNALALLRGDDTNLVLPTDGMDDARRRIAATLLAGRPTTEFG
ncbi:ULP1 Protease Ulp1 family [Pyrenophora tritici-repentis]|nr:ULP1 Protease Ulp1 family [Pyrenophora tritici-repentis]KAF7579263.1 ULP1, Protease, Ulp1 family [Pyrenophora tritici-repentis]KAG9378190.1 ULP1 Protease [Pyrenophora tritici-repentis]KAI1543707.1 ULP1 Protease Ulp1 family [Pyrenophora tritici-repentis]KAI1552164.1 ULP1 Protease Ulp1 family [Pyrenophora tritici-repentis]